MKNKTSIDIGNLLKIWTTEIDGDIPLKFEDELSVLFFSNDINRLLNKYFVLGRKFEQRKQKIKAVKRYKKLKNN